MVIKYAHTGQREMVGLDTHLLLLKQKEVLAH